MIHRLGSIQSQVDRWLPFRLGRFSFRPDQRGRPLAGCQLRSRAHAHQSHQSDRSFMPPRRRHFLATPALESIQVCVCTPIGNAEFLQLIPSFFRLLTQIGWICLSFLQFTRLRLYRGMSAQRSRLQECNRYARIPSYFCVVRRSQLAQNLR